jgi:hypothetical protein
MRELTEDYKELLRGICGSDVHRAIQALLEDECANIVSNLLTLTMDVPNANERLVQTKHEAEGAKKLRSAIIRRLDILRKSVT